MKSVVLGLLLLGSVELARPLAAQSSQVSPNTKATGSRQALIARDLHNASLLSDLRDLTELIAIPGYESAVADAIVAETRPLHPEKDSLGNVLITVGSGAPHRLIAVPMDEPGYVISNITPDGYLRVQRLPQAGLPLHYNDMMAAQPVLVQTHSGKWVTGIVAGESIHLLPGRRNVPDLDDLDNLYIDLGAQSALEVRQSGVDVLSPMAAERHLLPVGKHQFAATAIGDRFAAAAALELLRSLDGKPLQGSITFAFVTQQWNGGRGLASVLHKSHPDELIYLGRAQTPATSRSSSNTSTNDPVVYREKLGTGVWLSAAGAQQTDKGFLVELQAAAAAENAKLSIGVAAPIITPSYGGPVTVPARTAHLAIPLEWPTTAGETIDGDDLNALIAMLEHYLQGHATAPRIGNITTLVYPPTPARPAIAPTPETLLRSLILSYGVSEHEDRVRETVKALLPAWAKTTTDSGGNLILHLGKPSDQPGIVLMAHTDELGFRISNILPNGSLELENKGGGAVHFYWGHPALVHTGNGLQAGVIELPADYDAPAFKWPTDFRSPAEMSVGARTPEEVADLGIKIGDTVTIKKDYRTLLGTRVSGRSLDDRVGCAALVRAAWVLGPNLNRDVTLVWSTREELGLLGAVDYAKQAAQDNRVPATVFAIDTFVSADSPLESSRYADAAIGKGFVIRAIDNSNITPASKVDRLRALAQLHHIPVQYGVTGGGNDGAAFTSYGSVDVPLAWPLRYSHSPGELIDTRDLDGLAQIVTVIAKEW